ncbi:hypothetical protein [Desulforhabdus amnigena]|uniref:hypothetical protein n=1 Tax=Desulforhabdus amnigena TaxID=40218 RepID=UPI00249302B6|nr:hypothetical protein [Desulforhabdus amnigena]
MKPLNHNLAFQSILIGTKWNSGFLLPHRNKDSYLIEVSKNVVLYPISNQYFVRRNSLRMVFNYTKEIGLREVVRKIISRRKEKARNAKAMVAGIGRVLAGPAGGIPADSTVLFIGTNVHAEMFAAPLMMKGGIKGAGEGEVAQVNTWLGPSQLTRPIVSHRTPDCFYRERTVIGPRVPGTRRLIRNMSSPSQHTFYRRSRGHGTGTDPQERYRP